MYESPKLDVNLFSFLFFSWFDNVHRLYGNKLLSLINILYTQQLMMLRRNWKQKTNLNNKMSK